MTDFIANPKMPKASTKNRMKVPKRPARDSRATFQMMNSIRPMKAPRPQVIPICEIWASVRPKTVASIPGRRPHRRRAGQADASINSR